MFRGGNHDQAVSPLQALAKKAAHVLSEQAIIVPVELNDVLFCFEMIEKLSAGRHETSSPTSGMPTAALR
jgi:hypothetical protein